MNKVTKTKPRDNTNLKKIDAIIRTAVMGKTHDAKMLHAGNNRDESKSQT